MSNAKPREVKGLIVFMRYYSAKRIVGKSLPPSRSQWWFLGGALASHPSGRVLMCPEKNHFTPNFFYTGFTEYLHCLMVGDVSVDCTETVDSGGIRFCKPCGAAIRKKLRRW